MENNVTKNTNDLINNSIRQSFEPMYKRTNNASLNESVNVHNKTDGNLDNSLKVNGNLRGSLSTVKKGKSYHVHKNFPIPRLNLGDLLKNLEEGDESEEESTTTESANKNSAESNTKSDLKVKDTVDSKESVKENVAPTPSIQINNKPYEPAKVQPTTNNIQETKPKQQVDDSFELDFSVLSLATPSKEQPKKDQFATPNVINNPKIQFSAKKELGFPNFSKPKEKPLFAIQETPRVTKKHIEPKTEPLPETNNQNKKIIEVKNVKYEIMNILGKGGSSVVYQCRCQEKKLQYAIKCVSLSDPQTAQGYINEVEILSKLQNCEKIIKMFSYELIENEKKLLVVLEKGGEDLSTILKHIALRESHISIHMLLFYWMEMLYAVKEIHSHGIIHNDLKPANFIQAGGSLKLIDFGISRCVQLDNTSVIKTNPEGSCNYISPEAVKNESSNNINSPNYGKNKYKINFKSDVWSLGCILYQLVYRVTPFQHIGQLWQKLFTIVDPNHKIRYPDAPWVPQKIIRTIQSCLQFEKNRRPSVNDLIREYESSLLNIS